MAQGSVQTVTNRSYNGKTFYSVKLSDGIFYGFGTYRPSLKEGDVVTFDAIQNSKGYWDADSKSLEITSRPTGEVMSGVSAAINTYRKTTPRAGGKDDYWTNKEVRDVQNDHLRSLGAARNTSIEWIKFLVANEAIPKIPAVNKREDFFNLLIDDYTSKFMSESISTEASVEPDPAPEKAPSPKKKAKEEPVVEQDEEDWS